MPSESDLRHLLQGADPEGRAAIDLDAVLTRARRRRRPKVIAAQALGSVAVVGALFTAVLAVQPPQQAATMIAEDTTGGSEADAAPFVDEDALRIPDALMLNSCGEPPSDLAISDGPTLTVDPIVAQSGTQPIPVTVTLRGGALPGRGSSSLPVLTVIRDGIVVAQPMALDAISVDIDLPPDGSYVFETSLLAVQCEPSVNGDELVPLPAGQYEIRAALDFVEDGGDGSATLVLGPPSTLTIR